MRIGWQGSARGLPEFELLDEGGEENEKLFLSQRLSEAEPFAGAERHHSLVADEVAGLVYVATRIECFRVFVILRIVVDVVEEGRDCRSFWDGVGSDLDVLQGRPRNSAVSEAADPEAFLKDCVGERHLGLVLETGKTISADDLK